MYEYHEKYKTLSDSITIADMVYLLTGKKIDNFIDNTAEYLDILEESLLVAFYYFWQNKVRQEQYSMMRNFKRKNNKLTCNRCGKSENLEIHHIIPVAQWGGNDVNNLMLLCKDCHKIIDKESFEKNKKQRK